MSDGIVNAVLVIMDGNPIWVEDASSIATWGRLEGTMSVGEIDDVATATTIAEEWLAVRSQPMEANVYKAIDSDDNTGVIDYREGDTLTTPGLRVMEIALEPRPDGRMQSTPVFASKLQERFRRNAYKVERLIADGGGSAPVSNPPAETGSGLEPGKLQPRQLTSWSWNDSIELEPLFQEDLEEDERGWQKFPIDEPVRLTEMVLECDYLDEDDEQVADGPTRFRLMINGVAPLSSPALGSIPVDVEVASDEGSAMTPIFGTTILTKSDTVRVAPISNGGHINGSVTLNASEVV